MRSSGKNQFEFSRFRIARSGGREHLNQSWLCKGSLEYFQKKNDGMCRATCPKFNIEKVNYYDYTITYISKVGFSLAWINWDLARKKYFIFMGINPFVVVLSFFFVYQAFRSHPGEDFHILFFSLSIFWNSGLWIWNFVVLFFCIFLFTLLIRIFEYLCYLLLQLEVGKIQIHILAMLWFQAFYSYPNNSWTFCKSFNCSFWFWRQNSNSIWYCAKSELAYTT